jgi:hypothetical protein
MTRGSHSAKTTMLNMTYSSNNHMTLHSHISEVLTEGPNWSDIPRGSSSHLVRIDWSVMNTKGPSQMCLF